MPGHMQPISKEAYAKFSSQGLGQDWAGALGCRRYVSVPKLRLLGPRGAKATRQGPLPHRLRGAILCCAWSNGQRPWRDCQPWAEARQAAWPLQLSGHSQAVAHGRLHAGHQVQAVWSCCLDERRCGPMRAGDKPMDADTSSPGAFNTAPVIAGCRHVTITTCQHHQYFQATCPRSWITLEVLDGAHSPVSLCSPPSIRHSSSVCLARPTRERHTLRPCQSCSPWQAL